MLFTAEAEAEEPKGNGEGTNDVESELDFESDDENEADDTQYLLTSPLDFRILKLLLRRKLDINHFANETPLHCACVVGYPEVVRFLLQNGADKMRKDHSGCTPLMTALFHGHHELVEQLWCDEMVRETSDRDAFLRFLLHRCSMWCVRAMLQHAGHLLDITKPIQGGRTPLFDVMTEDIENVGVMRVLLKHDGGSAAVTIPDNEQNFPLHFALKEIGGNASAPEVCDLLFKHGADVEQMNSESTPIIHTINNAGSVKWLLEHGASPNAPARNGVYPLAAACHFHHSAQEVVKLLVEHNVDVLQSSIAAGLPNQAPNTPLQLALREQDAELCKLLLSCDVDTTHLQTQEPLPSVEDQPFKGIVQYIKEHQCRPRSLQRQARLIILRSLDFRPGFRKVDDPIGALGLPVPLMNFMRWKNFMKERSHLIEHNYCSQE